MPTFFISEPKPADVAPLFVGFATTFEADFVFSKIFCNATSEVSAFTISSTNGFTILVICVNLL